MNDIISEEWKRYKEELSVAIKETIERDNVEKETLYIMLNMLESSKLKPKGE